MDGHLYTCEACGRTYHTVVNPDCPRCAALGVRMERQALASGRVGIDYTNENP